MSSLQARWWNFTICQMPLLCFRQIIFLFLLAEFLYNTVLFHYSFTPRMHFNEHIVQCFLFSRNGILLRCSFVACSFASVLEFWDLSLLIPVIPGHSFSLVNVTSINEHTTTLLSLLLLIDVLFLVSVLLLTKAINMLVYVSSYVCMNFSREFN